jgi:hypothetical protein
MSTLVSCHLKSKCASIRVDDRGYRHGVEQLFEVCPEEVIAQRDA